MSNGFASGWRTFAVLATGIAVALAATAGAGAVNDAGEGLAKAKFVKVKCPKKAPSGKKVTCKIKGGIPAGPQGQQGPQGPAGPQGDTGADGVSGYETIRETIVDVFVPGDSQSGGRGLSAEQVVDCPAGKRAIGGGADLSADPNGGEQRQIDLSKSAPTNAGDGWAVQLFNDSPFGVAYTVEVFAICARA